MRKYRVTYWIGLFALAIAAAASGVLRDQNGAYFIWVGVLLAVGVVLGALTFALAKSQLSQPLRGMLIALCGYHALFGPVMLAYLTVTESSRNDDFALRIYPHLIAWIDSFE